MFDSDPEERVRVAIFDRYPTALHGLEAVVNRTPGFGVAVACSHAGGFFDALRQTPCDICVVDFSNDMGASGYNCGSSVVQRLRTKCSDMRIIAFSPTQDTEAEYVAFVAGANAFVPKEVPVDLLCQALRAQPCPPGQMLVVRDAKLVVDKPKSKRQSLSLRERETLRCLALGLSGTAAGQQLCRSAKTISTQKRNAMRKLGLPNDLALALYLERNVW